MFARLRALFDFDPETPAEAPDEDTRRASACVALMLQAAYEDGRLDDVEKERILTIIVEKLGIPVEQAGPLLRETQLDVDNATGLHRFTQAVIAAIEPEDRVALIEWLWEVVLADGHVHEREAAMMRKVVGLLGVSDRDSGAARKRVAARLEQEP